MTHRRSQRRTRNLPVRPADLWQVNRQSNAKERGCFGGSLPARVSLGDRGKGDEKLIKSRGLDAEERSDGRGADAQKKVHRQMTVPVRAE